MITMYALKCKQGYVTGEVTNIAFTSKPSEALYWTKDAAEKIATAFTKATGWTFKPVPRKVKP